MGLLSVCSQVDRCMPSLCTSYVAVDNDDQEVYGQLLRRAGRAPGAKDSGWRSAGLYMMCVVSIQLHGSRTDKVLLVITGPL